MNSKNWLLFKILKIELGQGKKMKIDTGGMAYLLVVYSIEFTLKIDNVQWTLNGLENICQKCYITDGKILN